MLASQAQQVVMLSFQSSSRPETLKPSLENQRFEKPVGFEIDVDVVGYEAFHDLLGLPLDGPAAKPPALVLCREEARYDTFRA